VGPCPACGRSQPPPLDLRAVEARLAYEGTDTERCEDITALLAHVRALRAALKPFKAAYEMAGHHYDDKHEFGLFLSAPSLYTMPAFKAEALHNAAAVLAQATDEEKQ